MSSDADFVRTESKSTPSASSVAGAIPTSDDPHLSLARRASKGDEQAANRLVAAVSTPLLRTATLILQDRHLAEDAVQEAFLSALKAVHRFDGRVHFLGWISRILVNRCYSYRRSPRTRPWLTVSDTELREKAAQGVIASRDPQGVEAQRLGEAEEVRQTLIQLPIKYRTVLVLHYYEDRSVQEIAELLGVTMGTVKSQLHRARKRMAALLGEGHANEG